MANYFIGIDENGQPFIAHASLLDTAVMQRGNKIRWRDRASARAKKYLQKVEDYYGKGKNLYLYTQDQVRAFANRGAAKAKFAAQHVGNKVGFGLKRKRDAALAASTNNKSERSRKSARMAADNYQKQYADSLLGKLDYRRSKFKVSGGVKGAVKRAGERVADKARDIAGYDERESLNNAQKAFNKAQAAYRKEIENNKQYFDLDNPEFDRNYNDNTIRAWNDLKRANEELKRAQEAYNKTLVGRRAKRKKGKK